MKVSLFMPAFSESTHTWISLHAIGLLEAKMEVEIICEKYVGLAHKFEKAANLDKIVKCIYTTSNLKIRVIKAILSISSWEDFYLLVKSRTKARLANNANHLIKKRFFKSKDFDIIHSHFGSQGVLITEYMPYIRSYRLFVAHFHGADIIAKRDYSELFKMVDIVATNSNYSKNMLIEKGASFEKVVVLPSYYNEYIFRREINEDIHLKIMKGAALEIFFVGRLEKYKGLENLVLIMKYLNSDRLNFVCHVIGDGSLRRELHNYKDIGIISHGFMTQEELMQIMVPGSIFLYPAITFNGRQENQGVVLLEAQAMGLIPVTTATGGIPEYVKNNYSGFVINDESDIKGMSDKIIELSKNPLARIEMMNNAQKWVEQYSIKTLTQRYISEIYKNSNN